jgi:hypothetical protein
MVEQRVKTVSQWFDSTPNHEIFRFLSEFSSKDLEGIKIFLIFTKKRTAECFFSGGSPYSPDKLSSPLYKLEM